jgi:hypothetical protein
MSRVWAKKVFVYKDIKVIRFCKTCKAEFRKNSGDASLGLCIIHRRILINTNWLIRYRSLSPERKRELFMPKWHRWVANNLELRRKQALASYHKNKAKPQNRQRKHAATRQPDL